jgi:hypothetical protein
VFRGAKWEEQPEAKVALRHYFLLLLNSQTSRIRTPFKQTKFSTKPPDNESCSRH